MLQNLTKLFILSLLLSQCTLKSNNSDGNARVFYTDRQNPYVKMQLPLEISWTHDKAGNPNQPINITITAKAMSDLTNVKLNLTLSPNLKLLSGDLTKTIPSLTTGNSSELNLAVSPEKTGSYDINILMSASLNGEQIGSARTLRFETSDFKAEKPVENPSGLHIIEGRTDNGK
jgi:hypothetical protein